MKTVNNNHSYVYIIDNGTFIKIGKANNTTTRAHQLQTASSTPLQILGRIPCESAKEAHEVEQYLHSRFAEYREIGEWFDLDYATLKEVEPRIEDVGYTCTTTDKYEPDHIKLYIGAAPTLHGLPTTAGDVMTELLKYVTYGTQEVVLNAAIKKRIAEAANVAVKTVDNRLQELVKKKIIDRVSTGTFILNPYLFGKGDWKTILELRNKNVHLKITYDASTGERQIKGTVNE